MWGTPCASALAHCPTNQGDSHEGREEGDRRKHLRNIESRQRQSSCSHGTCSGNGAEQTLCMNTAEARTSETPDGSSRAVLKGPVGGHLHVADVQHVIEQEGQRDAGAAKQDDQHLHTRRRRWTAGCSMHVSDVAIADVLQVSRVRLLRSPEPAHKVRKCRCSWNVKRLAQIVRPGTHRCGGDDLRLHAQRQQEGVEDEGAANTQQTSNKA